MPGAVRPVRKRAETESQIGQRWLLVAGVVLMLFGIGYFLKYAFEEGWIGPAFQVTLGFVAGCALAILGDRLSRRGLTVFGLSLVGSGLSVIYLSAFAASELYQLIPLWISFGLMIVVTALGCALAMHYTSIWLASLAFLGGFLAPMLMSAEQHWVLLSYLLILNIAVFVVTAVKHWQPLNYVGCLLHWLAFSFWFFPEFRSSYRWETLVFLQAYLVIYSLAPFLVFLYEPKRLNGFWLTILNSFIAFGFSYGVVSTTFSRRVGAAISLVYAVLFLAAAWYARKRNVQARAVITWLVAEGMTFLFLAWPLMFEGDWSRVFWGVQLVLLVWLAGRINDTVLLGGAIALALFLTATVPLYVFSDWWGLVDFSVRRQSAYWADFGQRTVENLAVIAGLFASANLERRRAAGQFMRWFEYFGLAALFLVLNFETGWYWGSTWVAARPAAISVVWSLFAAGLLAWGFVERRKSYRIAAIVLFFLAILKVMIIDLADVATPFRIVSCVVLGALLLAASFLYHRFSQRGDRQTP
jgi:uncharacterized membrane protein